MSALVVLAVGLLGGLGAVARFAVDGAVAGRMGRDFPYGTLVVNLSGSFVLGVLVGAALSDDAYRIAGTGLIGAYTTFSTWAFESHRLAEDGELPLAALNFAVSLVLGVAVAWLGRELGGAL
ncbi:MAG: fluoride exporter [Thermoleophilaceae bacterium]|nr:fluoride exporter [Thermoleophilaceae bacterium]